MAWEPQADVPGGFADEASLLAGLRAGRRGAFEALHDAFAAPIYNLALRIVDDPGEAQDVTQEVLIKVFRALPEDDAHVNLTAWLYRVTVNASFDHLRARKRRPPVDAREPQRELAAPVDEYERAELSRRVESTLRGLPKRQQVALVLRDVHGLSVGETASVLGLTKGSADVLLSRARSAFRRIFLAHADDVTPPPCRVAEEALAGGAGGGMSSQARGSLMKHARDCPHCRRTVELWGAAPLGLGLLIHQASLPAGLGLGATIAAAQAAGIAVSSVGAGAAGAVGASAAAGATAGAAGTAGTAGAGGAGLLTAVGSAAGAKIAILAVACTAAVGIATVASSGGSGTGAPQRTGSVTAAPAAQNGGAGYDVGEGGLARAGVSRGPDRGSHPRSRQRDMAGVRERQDALARARKRAGLSEKAGTGGVRPQSGRSASAGSGMTALGSAGAGGAKADAVDGTSGSAGTPAASESGDGSVNGAAEGSGAGSGGASGGTGGGSDGGGQDAENAGGAVD